MRFSHIFSLTSIFLLVSCGGSSDGSDSSSGMAGASDAELGNTVWSYCAEFSGTSSEDAISFMGDTFSRTFSSFTNNSCSGTPDTSSETVSGTYMIGDVFESPDGDDLTELNFEVNSAFGAALTSDLQYTLHDAFLIEGDTLYLTTLAERDEADRPVVIDRSEPYIR